MEISSLQAFLEVAEKGSFSAAAKSLFITQPAVSKRINLLETNLGSLLLDRSGRSVKLTSAGETLLPRAKSILREVKDAQLQMEYIAGNVGGLLRIATSHHIGLHRLPELLKSFHQSHADVELNISFLSSEAAIHAVLQRDVELAVVTLPEESIHALQSSTLWIDELYIVYSGTKKQSFADLVNEPAIFPSKETATRQLIERHLSEMQAQPIVTQESNYLETIKMLVSAGLGWSILPKTVFAHDKNIQQLDDLKITRKLGLVTRKNRPLSNAAKAFVTLLSA
ncbi:MAG: LysR family transcriptional regulator [Gammaproteobacteria bacterium]|nr:LysR family transcriptional regulator [Gammaproteobacteria bacterium]